MTTPWCVTTREQRSYDGRTTPRTAVDQAKVREVHGGAMVEGSMTQGAGQGPMAWTMAAHTPASSSPSGPFDGAPLDPPQDNTPA
ncbi:hypothetical protein FNZ23_27805, partial [Streptomyces benahoarensis]